MAKLVSDAIINEGIVKNVIVDTCFVTESPQLSGLPPSSGIITTTARLIEDPGLADPEIPAQPIPSQSSTTTPLALFREEQKKVRTVILSATVINQSYSLLRWQFKGSVKQISVWSNLNFNHFAGITKIQFEGEDAQTRQYSLLMGIGNADSEKRNYRYTQAGPLNPTGQWPVGLADLNEYGPDYKVIEGDVADQELVAVIQCINEHYREHGETMASNYSARIIAHEQKKAWLLANPPTPEDVNVSFWERSQPLHAPQIVSPERGNP